MTPTVAVPELAERLGHRADWLYRKGRLDRLYAEGMPRPISHVGRPQWERSTIEAWLQRHHPLMPKGPANDLRATPAPANDDAWAKHLAEAYRLPATTE
ncbi:MAG: hypothetical protein J0H94_11905 [Rhizobiales bacterium]|nr:hypothetical protein [Hyphomicrobiales bacterium]